MSSSTTPTASAPASFRDLLFGDTPLEQWGAGADPAAEPWSFFAEARAASYASEARGCLQRVLYTPGLESRHYLVAWNALRPLGGRPGPEEAKRLLGVVVEMPIDDRFDILACYEDNTARYLNHAGQIIIVDTPVPAVTAAIAKVFEASRPVVERIGPHTGPRPAPPTPGLARLSFLTPSGLHFGQGGADVFLRDPMAGPVIAAATTLLQTLIALAKK